jgi:DNA-binding SARP family transcriptional activator
MTLLNLRSALEGADWVRIEATRDALRLIVEPLQVDVFQFERAAASDHPDTRTMACDLYVGDLLARFPEISSEFDRFLEDRRAALRSVALSLLLETMRTTSYRGDASGFERVFQQLVQIDPVNDAAACLAIETWADAGQLERIEVEYRRFQAAYKDAFDALPPKAIHTAYKAAVVSLAHTLVPQPHRKRENTATSHLQPPLRSARASGHGPCRRPFLRSPALPGSAG